MTHRALRLFQQRVLISASCARDYPLNLAPLLTPECARRCQQNFSRIPKRTGEGTGTFALK
jgi:hypothetical protein